MPYLWSALPLVCIGLVFDHVSPPPQPPLTSLRPRTSEHPCPHGALLGGRKHHKTCLYLNAQRSHLYPSPPDRYAPLVHRAHGVGGSKSPPLN